MSIESVVSSNHPILCCSLLLLPSIFPSTRVFSNGSALRIRWPNYWRFSISPSNEYSGLISFRTDWLDLLAVQETPPTSSRSWDKSFTLWGSRFSYVWKKRCGWLFSFLPLPPLPPCLSVTHGWTTHSRITCPIRWTNGHPRPHASSSGSSSSFQH